METKNKDLNSSKFTNISNMKTIKIKEEIHHKLNLYRVKNRLRSLSKAIEELLKNGQG